MSRDQPDISRREMLRGRFLTRLLRDAAAPAPNDAAAPPSPRKPMVMRYPKTTSDVDAQGGPGAQPTASSRSRGAIPVLRPPGAVDEQTFLAECTRCNECITACPHDAIVHAPPRFRQAAGTPMIDPDRQPCLMCDDFPCIDACEPDVLSHLLPKTMGTARIVNQTCLAHQGTTCTACHEQCPVPGAFDLSSPGKPRINESDCTGCGVCRYVCPSPENAVLLMPTFVRPTRAATKEIDP